MHMAEDAVNRVTAMVCLALSTLPKTASAVAELLPETEPAGYLARLLINESAFPGERGYVSETDTQTAMRSILLVIDARITEVPSGYTRTEVAGTPSADLIEVMTAGGRGGQMAGFFRDRAGKPAIAARVKERVASLQRIAAQGEPDRFTRLIAYAQSVASAYLEGVKPSPDLYASIRRIPPKNVTGKAYGWMTDQDYYHPGGSFVRIPDRLRGRLGGNRFFTLERRSATTRGKAASGGPLVYPKLRK